MVPKFSLADELARLTDSAPLRPSLCAWCPTFDSTIEAPGQSHGMCPTCAEAFERQRDELAGSTCGSACGYCGRCS